MGIGTLFSWKKTSPDETAKRPSARRSRPLGVAATVHLAIGAGDRLSRRSCGASRSTPGALGSGCGSSIAFTPDDGHLALRLQRGGHRAGVRAPPPGARAGRDGRAAATPAVLVVAGRSAGARAHARHAAAALAPALRRVHRAPRDRPHVRRFHGPVVERRQGSVALPRAVRTSRATTR